MRVKKQLMLFWKLLVYVNVQGYEKANELSSHLSHPVGAVQLSHCQMAVRAKHTCSAALNVS